MNYLSQIWTKVNQWSQKISTKALNAAYQSALAIRELEDRYFQGKMISPEGEGGQSMYAYHKSALERELVKINFNFTQLRVSHFLESGKTSSKTNDSQPSQTTADTDTEISDKLLFIETVIAKYRKQPEKVFFRTSPPPKPLKPETPSPPNSFENINQEFFNVSENLETGLGQNHPLRGHKFTAKYEQDVIEELRRLRQQRKITWRILALLLFVPLLVQVITKNVIYAPLINYGKVNQDRFELVEEVGEKYLAEYRKYRDSLEIKQLLNPEYDKFDQEAQPKENQEAQLKEKTEELMLELKEKTKELMLEAAYERQEGLINILADLTAVLAFLTIVYFRRRDCLIALSFLNYSFSGLNVITRVFIFILLTDMFVGFHSAEGWEVILNKTFEHFGLAENPNFNGFFIATIPVIMDSIFKLLIFNYLTRTSPTSVAILEKMNQ